MQSPGRASVLALVVSVLFVTGCPNSAGISCPTGQTLCGGRCIYVANDPANCGACGNVCPGSLVCISGACGCPMGLSNCANICVDENVDGNNCGGCGVGCVAGTVCSAGACAVTCGVNLTQCVQSCIDTQNDPQNCGMCGHACDHNTICCAGNCVLNDTNAHCGSCAPCTAGMFCFDAGGDMGLTCSPG
ncbi:MAG TPA: MXAN_6577-like cysteine-rich protein [Polyangia bacterium]